MDWHKEFLSSVRVAALGYAVIYAFPRQFLVPFLVYPIGMLILETSYWLIEKLYDMEPGFREKELLEEASVACVLSVFYDTRTQQANIHFFWFVSIIWQSVLVYKHLRSRKWTIVFLPTLLAFVVALIRNVMLNHQVN